MSRQSKSPVVAGILLSGFVLLGCCCGPCSLVLRPARQAADPSVLSNAVPAPSLPTSKADTPGSPSFQNSPPNPNQTPKQPLSIKSLPKPSVESKASNPASAVSTPKPAKTPPAPEAIHEPVRPVREWTSGQYKTAAQFLGLKDGIVKLQKQPSGTADVPLERLAAEDREFVKQHIRINAAENVMVARVTSVPDGDTITVVDEEKREHKVKLKGIDAPELGQVFGDKARQALESLLLGKTPWIESHEIDRDGFVKGKVYLEGQLINLHMLGEGLAWHQKVEEASPRFRNAELVARTNRVGLWINESPAPPWEFREHKARTGQ